MPSIEIELNPDDMKRLHRIRTYIASLRSPHISGYIVGNSDALRLALLCLSDAVSQSHRADSTLLQRCHLLASDAKTQLDHLHEAATRREPITPSNIHNCREIVTALLDTCTSSLETETH